jgi:hypothetical protein
VAPTKFDPKRETKLFIFLKENFNIIENTLVENELVDLYRDDLKINLIDQSQKNESNELNIIKEVKTFDFE